MTDVVDEAGTGDDRSVGDVTGMSDTAVGRVPRRSVQQIRAEVAARRQQPAGEVDWPADLLADLWRLPEAAPHLAAGTVAAVLRFLHEVGMTQRHIARRTGQSQGAVSALTAGRRAASAGLLWRIAEGLHLPADTLTAPSTPDTGRRPRAGRPQ